MRCKSVVFAALRSDPLRIACDLDLNEDATVGELLQQVAKAVSEPVECLRLFRSSSNQRIAMA